MHILTGCDPCASNIDQEFTAFIAPHLVKTSQDDKDDEDEDGDEDEDEEDWCWCWEGWLFNIKTNHR